MRVVSPRTFRWLLPLLLLLLAACQPSGGKRPGEATREVVDMAGRRMTVPVTIERASATRPGSVTLYAIAPDLMVNRSLWMTDGAERFMSPAYLKLPFSDGSSEEIVRLHPDVIVSYFSITPQSIDQADRLSQRTGVPVFMVDMEMKRYPEAFAAMGELLGRQEQAAKMTAYIEKWLLPVFAKAARISASQRKRVYYAEGNRGLNTDPSGSFHSQIIDLVGATNVAQVNLLSGKGMSAVSMEQVLQWNPDEVIVWTGMGPSMNTYRAIAADPLWQRVPAVREGRIHQIPFLPFGWFDRPPGTNRILGTLWLAELLYPDVYRIDLEAAVREYFTIFFHRDLTDAELREVLHPFASTDVAPVQSAKSKPGHDETSR
ncbi:ABC transporter substrate-binding protein [Chlorobaculum sp. MV4-Y]|uniref:ABC transporter substrate-binding protein n=1 Tax=Chlorobaculum sp. MV4-Y TaxID=2976335 RepID=UPI0021AF6A73|nr:ABC transporter substrate-binding protein [Chlorobaculum sp. MV4-Y]UWX57171.1 ABC transporter substrate-binding protein [Chlorobaculum sp. MV4-Y]